MSLSISKRSFREVHLRRSAFLSEEMGSALTNHQTHTGPLGQRSGSPSMSGRGEHESRWNSSYTHTHTREHVIRGLAAHL